MQEETTSKTTNNEETTNSPQIENKEDVVSQKKSFWEVIKKILRALKPLTLFKLYVRDSLILLIKNKEIK